MHIGRGASHGFTTVLIARSDAEQQEGSGTSR